MEPTQRHQVHSQSRVTVDYEACDRLVSLLSTWKIPADKEETQLPDVPRVMVPNLLLAVVAICHQTSPIGHAPLRGRVDGSVHYGWDFLLRRFEAACRADTTLLLPATWRALSAGNLISLLSDKEYGSTPSNPHRRAALLNDLGTKMMARGWNSAQEMYEHCGGRIAIEAPNLADTLALFDAFRDPVRKKTFFFLALMSNFGLWQYKDSENLGPPVDYHEIRGHLRIGTVCLHDAEIERKVREMIPVDDEEDVLIRSAVFDAISYIASRLPNASPSQLHYLFWNLFRAICIRENPKCYAIEDIRILPERYAQLVMAYTDPPKCPFSEICRSAGAQAPISHPAFEGDFH